ncbi:MAG: NHL repeat-containing protein [Acidobacteria bacterium]|nr:NHL repeat-containing protein [Acidobacteriota bacterium]
MSLRSLSMGKRGMAYRRSAWYWALVLAGTSLMQGCGPSPPRLVLVEEAEAGVLAGPFGVSVTPSGEVLIADTDHGLVKWLDDSGKLLHTIGEGVLSRPLAVTWAPWDEILVADFEADRIFRFKPDGQYLGSWGEPGEGPGELSGPCGMASASDRFYVLEFYNHRVQVFDRHGRSVEIFDGSSSETGKFHYPGGIALEPGGSLLVADTHRYVLRRFTSDGVERDVLGRQGTLPGEFDDPMGVTVDAQGRIAVADSANYRIQILDANGAVLAVANGDGRWHGTVHSPTGVAFNREGDLWVADPGHDRVEMYRLQ